MSSEPSGSAGRILLLLGRLALAAVFLIAAYAKLKPQAAMPWSGASVKTSLSMFAMQVDSYQLLPVWAVNAAAHLLPFFELLLGLWLLLGFGLRASSVVATLVLGLFLGVMTWAHTRGLEISCGCFGPGEQISAKTLIRDGSLLALSAAITLGAFLTRRKKVSATIPSASPERAS